jgi:hypothetical protein
MSIGGIGAPIVSIEKLEEGNEGVRALRALENSPAARSMPSSRPRSAAATRSNP